MFHLELLSVLRLLEKSDHTHEYTDTVTSLVSCREDKQIYISMNHENILLSHGILVA